MKTLEKILSLTLIVLLGIACSKENDPAPEPTPVLSDAKQITSFVFRAVDNLAINQDVTGVINEAGKVIEATVPYNTDISNLRPVIEISQGASVTSVSAQDFSTPVSYEVTAENGTTSVYTATVDIVPNNESNLVNFDFLASENDLTEDVFGKIDEETHTVFLEIPLSADITKLAPTLLVSPDASVSPEGVQDFSEPVIYTITAQDGSTTEYMVNAFYSEYEILVAFYNSNPGSTLSWDISDENFGAWPGVTTTNGRITKLDLSNKELQNLIPQIGFLRELRTLVLFSNDIAEIPAELGRLKQLTGLFLSSNKFTEIPPEIGQLTELTALRLANNFIDEVPVEFGQLVNLDNLWLQNCGLTKIPVELSKLTLLTQLRLEDNNLTSIPQEVCDLTTLYGTEIRTDMGVICE